MDIKKTIEKLREKLKFIEDNHLGEWLKVRRETENELSEKNPMFCVCGRLATGLHESNCRRFQNKVTSETIKKLSYLFKK